MKSIDAWIEELSLHEKQNLSRLRIAEAYLTKVTKGKQVANDDDKVIIEFYYSLTDCIITLR